MGGGLYGLLPGNDRGPLCASGRGRVDFARRASFFFFFRFRVSGLSILVRILSGSIQFTRLS